MYLNIGKNTVILDREIIGIFDLDNCSQSYLTREFLSAAERAGSVINAAEDLPNSFLITGELKKKKLGSVKVILTQSTSRTLDKRIYQMQRERSNTWRKSMN